MSENRKTINQYLGFKGDTTISELIMSIPNDFKGVVEISDGDLIITDEDVYNSDLRDIMLFNELSIEGNLRQEISDKLKDQKYDITLIIFGDFYCGNSVSIEYFGLSVKGNVTVFGDDISAKNIDVTEDLYCSGNITADGLIAVKGDIEAKNSMISSKSVIRVRGDLESDCITAYNLEARGDVLTGDVEAHNYVDVRGNLECSGIEAKNINVRGNLSCDTSVKSKGTLYIGGDVKCYQIIADDDVTIRGQADVSDKIEASCHKVRIGKTAGTSINAYCECLQIG